MDWGELGRTIQPWATTVGAALTSCGVLIAARSLAMARRTNKAKFAFDLSKSFLKEAQIKVFWSRLNYNSDETSWRFDLSKFRRSDDERDIDEILHKFTVIGHMIRCRSIDVYDINSLYFTCRQVFHNAQVREYLRFVQIDLYLSDGFVFLQFGDALYCYEQMTKWAVKTKHAGQSELDDCQNFLSELQSLHAKPQLRKEIAARIGYAPRIPPARTEP